ncbi:MAG: RsmD family RNA methyltransferase [Actinomycetota bacterium]|nr:RsmD family RNA methyltransferase [Actinomycetota bacterium]
MRIIAGTARSIRLGPVPPGVRPVSDRAREGLFSSLGDRVPGARILDLYAGTGALGIEALSRGASGAVFVESDARAARGIRSNLETTAFGRVGAVRRRRVLPFLRFELEPLAGPGICFLDPPYTTPRKEVEEVLRLLGERWQGVGKWTVALTRPVRDHTIVIPVNWQAARRLVYGDSLVTLYQEV